MSDTHLSEVEQKYFDTRGASAIPEEAPPITEAEPGPAEVVPKAADVPAEDNTSVEDDKPETDNPGKFVRHGAFHEERQRRKEIEQNFNAYREKEAAERARLEERLNYLAQSFAPPQPQPQLDPVERLAQVEQVLQQRLQIDQQQRQQEEQLGKFVHAVTSSEQEFRKMSPDYDKAIEFAKASRLEELTAYGFPEDEAKEILQNDIINLANEALRRGWSPASSYYNYAKVRGWGKEAPPQALTPAPADKIKNIAAGQAAGKSLSTAPGTSQPALTLKALADMPQDEFDKIDAKTWRKMMGG